MQSTISIIMLLVISGSVGISGSAIISAYQAQCLVLQPLVIKKGSCINCLCTWATNPVAKCSLQEILPRFIHVYSSICWIVLTEIFIFYCHLYPKVSLCLSCTILSCDGLLTHILICCYLLHLSDLSCFLFFFAFCFSVILLTLVLFLFYFVFLFN